MVKRKEVAVKHRIISSIVVIMLSFCSCSGPEIQLVEVDVETVSSTETVHMNNCGGMDSSEQIAQRSFATSLELDPLSESDYKLIEDMIGGKYGLFKGTTKSQILKAPAGTNMEFSLKWSVDVYTGNILQGGNAGKYVVHVPIAVELISIQDMGCASADIDGDSNVREALTVFFKDGAKGVSTESLYSGYVTIIVQGTGRASGAQKSDAFYVFTDFNGESIKPMRYAELNNFTLWINGEPADMFVDPIPPYNSDHVYEFTIKAPDGKLVFAVGDVYVADNDGYYTVQILK